MIFNDLLIFYTSLLEKRKCFEAELNQVIHHSICTRKGKKDVRYIEINYSGISRHDKTISKEEYASKLSENIQFYRIRKALDELEILIRFFEHRVANYQKTVSKEYEKLSVAASLAGPNLNSIYAEGEHVYKTKRGDMVKSKSEQTIADALYDNGVDYEYESAYWTYSYVPDFIIRDSVSGRTVIWEHFGMMSDQTYVMKTLTKIRYYESIGFRLGDNFIATFEMYRKQEDYSQSASPLLKFDSARANEIVQRYFTPHVFPYTA